MSTERRFYLGMDGGGTKSAFILIDDQGQVLARHEAGSAYYLETGMDSLRATVRDGTLATLALARLQPADLRQAFFGLPVYGEDDQTRVLDSLPASVLPRERYHCDNDMICGWAGSLGGSDGINVVAGTGSICYGEYAGRSARCGGWGELFSDEGSAYWIARQGLTLFSRMSDGRAPRGPWHDILRRQLGSRRDIELGTYVAVTLANDRSRIAALSRLVHEAAVAGDDGAQAIFAQAGRELAALVEATRAQLKVPETVELPVSHSGGVFATGELVLASFRTQLESAGFRFELVKPRFTPVIGAAIHAARLAGEPLAPAALARLQ